MKLKSLLFSLLLTLQINQPVIAAIPPQIVSAAASGITTTVFFDQLYKFAQQTIADARNAGDFLAIRAAGQALLVLDQFKIIYEEEMDVSLKKIDRTAYEQLSRVQSSLDKLHQDFKSAKTTISDFEAVSLELASKIDPQSNRSFITSYTPKVFLQSKPSPFQIRITGIALDDSNLRLINGKDKITAKIVDHNHAELTLPSDLIENASPTSKNLDFILEYETVGSGWFNRTFGRTKTIRGSLIVATLPPQLGTYSYTSHVSKSHRSEQPKGRSDAPIWLPQFKGVNDDIPQAIQASLGGWKIDLSTIGFMQGEGGGNSTCTGILPTEQNEYAPAFYAHVGRIQQGLNAAQPGYVNCGVWYTEYAVDPNFVVDGPQSGPAVLTWNEAVINKPDRLVDLTVNIKTFEDSQQRSFTASDGSDKLYEIRYEPSRVVIIPKIPDDYIN
jgi:hypothetical protein